MLKEAIKMKLNVNNIEFNHINKNLKLLEDTYRQSNDKNVRNAVKEQVFNELCKIINNFKDKFFKTFDLCNMNSLKDIDLLKETILGNIEVIKLQPINIDLFKKNKKLKNKPLKLFVESFNKAITKSPLTYYSQIIDQNFIIMFPDNEKYDLVVSNISKTHKTRKSLCNFCNTFRDKDEIIFVVILFNLVKENIVL